ncbi:MAG: four helix bundle protein [Bacteroidetes bacterium]|nr:four helix bundle protein [Bacteroidota bacterium]MBS1930896.1 four helix bundle protein [Bacteroidota bacterium]
MSIYNHFYDLQAYKTYRAFRKKISLLTKKYFPKTEEYHLKAQAMSSARSLTANIAEGFLQILFPGNHPDLQAIKRFIK